MLNFLNSCLYMLYFEGLFERFPSSALPFPQYSALLSSFSFSTHIILLFLVMLISPAFSLRNDATDTNMTLDTSLSIMCELILLHFADLSQLRSDLISTDVLTKREREREGGRDSSWLYYFIWLICRRHVSSAYTVCAYMKRRNHGKFAKYFSMSQPYVAFCGCWVMFCSAKHLFENVLYHWATIQCSVWMSSCLINSCFDFSYSPKITISECPQYVLKCSNGLICPLPPN